MTAITATRPASWATTFGHLAAFAHLEVRRAFRNRRYLMFSVAFPVIFYLLYTGVLNTGERNPDIDGVPWTSYFLVSMATYGAMGAALFSAQVIALERTEGWVRLLRTTPLRPALYVVTKLLVSWVVVVPSLVLVSLAGLVLNHVSAVPADLVAMIVALAIGSLPFAAFGILLGYTFDGASAQGAAMITYFTLAIVGGLWAPVSTFPDTLATIASVLPSYRFANLGHAVAAGRLPDIADVAILGMYTVAIGALVVWRYRTDQGRARG